MTAKSDTASVVARKSHLDKREKLVYRLLFTVERLANIGHTDLTDPTDFFYFVQIKKENFVFSSQFSRLFVSLAERKWKVKSEERRRGRERNARTKWQLDFRP